MAVKIANNKWQARVDHEYISEEIGVFRTKWQAEREEKKITRKLNRLFATKLEDIRIHYEG